MSRALYEIDIPTQQTSDTGTTQSPSLQAGATRSFFDWGFICFLMVVMLLPENKMCFRKGTL